ncbi:response regulator [Luteimonas sp. R10]|uniref:response regulator n=1 Tax=Luteimonas sp. R10 TaxID=3108176 RepID=UPI0030857567|nr:response regulator [Luteimonas sp. R10]
MRPSNDPRHILVVEDESLLAMLLEDLLTDLGMRVCVTASIEDALRAVEAQSPLDLALLDVNIGGRMVFPVAQALDRRGIPFAFATGYGEQGLPEGFRQRPVVSKPFSLAELHRVLDIIGKQQALTGAC